MEKQHKEYELLVATRQHWREILIAEQKKEQAVLERRDLALEARQRKPCRTRDPQLDHPVKSRSGTASKTWTSTAAQFWT
jgi:hypothetical protein